MINDLLPHLFNHLCLEPEVCATMQLAKVDFLNIGPSRDGPNRSVLTPLLYREIDILINFFPWLLLDQLVVSLDVVIELL